MFQGNVDARESHREKYLHKKARDIYGDITGD
ncbi:hypothetical protein BN8_04325 [Fibrisoma limi BUZ 3]|uniref:Uncharacterized protein n=1 Tax=Fibrisoma limi BUZ 3 TaxID=1185876 RepID=I2GMG3_9BACT|nr:hypothetical protein BN8_04325 [Fibrisoma limi BUZ 3]